MRWGDEEYTSNQVLHVRRHRKHRSWGYKLAALTAPIFLIPVFIVIVVAFCLLIAPLAYLAVCVTIIRSGWRATEVEYWADERGRGV